MNITRNTLFGTVVAFGMAMAPIANAGSAIGGNPSNGGGATFGIENLQSALGAEELTLAIAAGDPAGISAALLSAVAASGFSTGDRLTPFPGLTGAQTVTVLTNEILAFAASLGLAANDPAILALLEIARTADDVA